MTEKKPPQSVLRETGEILEILEWARNQGAVMVKVDGVEVVWPPPQLEAHDIVENEYMSNEKSLREWREMPVVPGVRR